MFTEKSSPPRMYSLVPSSGSTSHSRCHARRTAAAAMWPSSLTTGISGAASTSTASRAACAASSASVTGVSSALRRTSSAPRRCRSTTSPPHTAARIAHSRSCSVPPLTRPTISGRAARRDPLRSARLRSFPNGLACARGCCGISRLVCQSDCPPHELPASCVR